MKLLNLNLQTSTNSLLNWCLQDKEENKSVPYYSNQMFLRQVSDSYNAVFQDIKSKKMSVINMSEFINEDYQHFSSFVKFQEKVVQKADYFENFIIQGSYGDLSVIDGWSDLDAIAVVDVEKFKGRSWDFISTCKSLDRHFRKIDPYQHHGIQYIEKRELLNYPNLYYPINLYSDAKSILSNDEVIYSSCNSQNLERLRLESILNMLMSSAESGVMKHHGKQGKYLLENFKDMHTMYQMKYFLSIIMLIPTLWLNCKGVYCRKKDSFDLIKDYFLEEDLEIISKASQIRSGWKMQDDKSIKRNLIPDHVVKNLGSDYLKRGGRVAKLFSREINSRLPSSYQ